jgi:hypothetical protein
VIAQGYLAVSLGHAEPVAIFAERDEGLVRVVAADSALVELAVDAGEAALDRAEKPGEILLAGLFERVFQQRDGLRVVADVVVADGKLRGDADAGFGFEPGVYVLVLVGADCFERLLVPAERLDREREQAFKAGQVVRCVFERFDRVAERLFGLGRVPVAEALPYAGENRVQSIG